jgi:hypothetical protein
MQPGIALALRISRQQGWDKMLFFLVGTALIQNIILRFFIDSLCNWLVT